MQKRHHYTNGVIEILVGELADVPAGFHLGRLPTSQETRKKQSEKHKGLKHSEETRRKISEHSNNNRSKAIQTNLEKRGVAHVMQDPNVRAKIEATKRLNNSFNTSKSEEEYYIELCQEYGAEDIIRNYKESRYPYRCDFYIKSLDLFIELNAHWTHGGHPFDATNSDDIKTLNNWQKKAKKSQFYRNAIYTWTQLDPKKQTIAKQNKLNYKMIY